MKQIALCIAAAAAAFAIVAAYPVQNSSQQNSVNEVTTTAPASTAPSNAWVSLAAIDADLRRPLVDAAGPDAPASATAACVLLGTSIDAARSMALIQLPDGTSRWLSLGEPVRDGYQLKRVDRRSVTLLEQDRTVELILPDAASVGPTP